MKCLLYFIVASALLCHVCKCWGAEKNEFHQDLKDLLSEEADIGDMGDVDDAEDEDDILKCTSVRDLTPGVQNGATHECCKVPTEDGEFEVKCLPSFIIAGTQKSGTTVLSAYLANHKDVSFARKKELHYFSNDKYYRKGLVDGYLDYFRRWNYTEPGWKDRPPLYGEATPYYLASRKACPRMAQVLGTNTKLIVLVREPVSRAFSEYQMKARRVRQQADFIQVCQAHSLEIYECLGREDSTSVRARGGNEETTGVKLSMKWKSIKACLPDAVKEHFHWSKFVSALEDHASKASSVDEVLQACFDSGAAEAGGGEVSSKSENDGGGNYGAYVPQFLAKACLKKHAKETLGSLEESFFGEINAFHECAQNESQVAVQSDQFYNYAVESPDALDKTVGRCLHVKSGISNQYVYRSLYAVQLFHCFKSFSKEQVLVLPSERLRSHPRETVAQALRFIGAEPGTYPDDIAVMDNDQEKEKREGSGQEEKRQSGGGGRDGVVEDAITRAVKKYFPVFEKNTGWRLYGDYEPLEQSMAVRLRRYFRPFNEMLFTMLGERFHEWEIGEEELG